MNHIEALKQAYLAGFMASFEGYNGEYPFQDKGRKPEDDPAWCRDRDNALRTAIEQAEKQEPVAIVTATNHLDGRVKWLRPFSEGIPLGTKFYTTPPAAQPAPVQVDHCIWARNGNTPCPHTAASVQEPVAQYSDIVSDGGMDPRNKFDTPPAAKPAPVQEPVTDAQKRAAFERFWVTEIGDKDDLTYGGLGYAINRVAVAWEAWKAAAPAQTPGINQCGETCERAKLCAVCARRLQDVSRIDEGKTAAPVQEPVNWSVYNSGAEVASGLTFSEAWDYMTPERLARQWCAVCVVDQSNMPVETPAAQRQWTGLTDEEIALVCGECAASAHNWNDISFARAIEAKLKEKNT